MKLRTILTAAVLSSGLFAAPAFAVTTVPNCTLQQVGYDSVASGEIVMTCDMTNYYFASASIGGTCSTLSRSTDMLKTWMALLQSALLSGKTVNFDYTSCGGWNYLTKVTLNK